MSKANYTIEPDRIVIRPSWGTGWETVLSEADQAIIMRYKFFGVRLPLKRQIPYSEVKRIRSMNKDRPTVLSWLTKPPGQMRIGDMKPFYHIMATTTRGKTISIGVLMSPDIASEIERQLLQRLGLSGDEAQPGREGFAISSAMCRYHPDMPAEFECTDCHKRFCSKCVKEISGKTYCKICQQRHKVEVKPDEYKEPKGWLAKSFAALRMRGRYVGRKDVQRHKEGKQWFLGRSIFDSIEAANMMDAARAREKFEKQEQRDREKERQQRDEDWEGIRRSMDDKTEEDDSP